MTIIFVTAILCVFLWLASLPTSYPKKRKTGRRRWPGRTAKLTRWRRDGSKIYTGKSSTEFIQKAVRAIAEMEREGNGIPAAVVIAKLEAKMAAARVLLQAKKGGVS